MKRSIALLLGLMSFLHSAHAEDGAVLPDDLKLSALPRLSQIEVITTGDRALRLLFNEWMEFSTVRDRNLFSLGLPPVEHKCHVRVENTDPSTYGDGVYFPAIGARWTIANYYPLYYSDQDMHETWGPTLYVDFEPISASLTPRITCTNGEIVTIGDLRFALDWKIWIRGPTH